MVLRSDRMVSAVVFLGCGVVVRGVVVGLFVGWVGRRVGFSTYWESISTCKLRERGVRDAG